MSGDGRGKAVFGRCDPRFEAVADAFRANFAERGDTGGAVAVSLDGLPVVDLWGGHQDADDKVPWAEETLVNVFSVSKAVATLIVLRLVERGLLDLDGRVAALWPSFGAAGKSDVTVRDVLSHRAALPGIARPLAADAMLDHALIAQALAEQAPWWPPGAAHGYHVNTFGFLLGEIVRRAAGTSLGRLVASEIAAPLGADFHIGLAPVDQARTAHFRWPDAPIPPPPPANAYPGYMRWATYWNPAGVSGRGFVNTAAWRAAELPSTNGHATARAIARIYSALAAGGAIGGTQILSAELLKEAVREHSFGPDLILERVSRFGLGFQLTMSERPLGPNEGAFGHFGAGGSLGFCDPQAGVALGYVTNDMGPRWQNPRNKALIDAVYACL